MSSRNRHAITWLGAVACLALGARAQQRYAFDAAGRPAHVDRRWALRRDGVDDIDPLTAFVQCGSRMVVSDTGSRLYRVDVRDSTATLRPFAGEEQGIGRPAALAADCERDRLYVVNAGLRTVLALKLETGEVVSRQPFKRELYETRSAALAGPDTLYIGGLWNADTQRGLPSRDAATFFESTWLGEKLTLSDGSIDGALPSYESKCTAAGACTFGDLDTISHAEPAAWIAVHGTSTQVAVYDARGSRTRTIDVTSPKFRRDGTELPVATPPDVTERWKSRNSLIRRVFGVAGHLVTVHTLTEIGPDWKFGQQTKLWVFMNIHAVDGTPAVSDVGLVDVPIGRDDSNLYAVDYGAGGRRNGATGAALVRIAIKTGTDVVR